MAHPTDTLSLLKDISNGVSTQILYQSREDEGTQSPTETLNRGWGSCRGFAVLLAEAARRLGFSARIVAGYLSDPEMSLFGSAGSGSTHAWVGASFPGAVGLPLIQRTEASGRSNWFQSQSVATFIILCRSLEAIQEGGVPSLILRSELRCDLQQTIMELRCKIEPVC